MPFEVAWSQPERVIQVVFSGQVSLDDITGAVSQVNTLLDSARPPAHILISLAPVITFPLDIGSVSAALKMSMGHAHAGWTLMYGSNKPVVRFAANIIMQVSRVDFRLFETEAAARQFLATLLDE
ncbi:MAG: hypothetical protein MUE40_14675 [Anaerolineae bacterium]|jgi:hypothetical protein|nr:hypothetical protein [Anaerolineae bacterium]